MLALKVWRAAAQLTSGLLYRVVDRWGHVSSTSLNPRTVSGRRVSEILRRRAGHTAVLLGIGIMDLRAMAFVTAAITAERLAHAGERVARTVGAVVVRAGVLLIARAAGLR